MPYDERLANRVRRIVYKTRGLEERTLFGGLAFMLRGHMTCGVMNTELVVRLDREGVAAALKRKHTRPFDFTGRAMHTMVCVSPNGLRRSDALRSWVQKGLEHAASLPAK